MATFTATWEAVAQAILRQCGAEGKTVKMVYIKDGKVNVDVEADNAQTDKQLVNA